MNMILYNAKIRTMDDNLPIAEAIAIENGIITKIGSNEDVLHLKQSETKLLDMSGRTILPGFNDSHMHLLNYAYSKRSIDLIDAQSLDDLIEMTSSFIDNTAFPTNSWIMGRGWCQNSWPDKDIPTRKDLDKISDVHPIILVRVCGHVAVVNSKALELLGLTESIPSVQGGQIMTDANGIPTGVFSEKALNLIYDSLPEPSINEIKQMIIDASNDVLSKGITSVQTDDFESIPGRNYENIIAAYESLAKEHHLPIRVYEQCLLPEMERLSTFLAAGFNTGYGDDFFRIGPLKLLADGSLGARTALLCKPYSDDESISGVSVFSQQQLDDLIQTAYRNSMQIAVHCIGDKAMHMVFESYEKVLSQDVLHLKADPRLGIIHCQITDADLLQKFKKWNIIAHIQPIFIQSDLHMADARIGYNRSKTSYCWKTLHETGVHVAHGSDCPVEKFDVLPGIYCAVTRKDMTGFPKNGWHPEQCLSVYDAVKGFTIGAAYASYDENKKGSLSENKFADIVVLSDDIFEIDKQLIKDTNVVMTIVNGEIKYMNKAYISE